MSEVKLYDFEITMQGPNGSITDYTDYDRVMSEVLIGIDEVVKDFREMIMMAISKKQSITIEIHTQDSAKEE